jgi:hypothetical protein
MSPYRSLRSSSIGANVMSSPAFIDLPSERIAVGHALWNAKSSCLSSLMVSWGCLVLSISVFKSIAETRLKIHPRCHFVPLLVKTRTVLRSHALVIVEISNIAFHLFSYYFATLIVQHSFMSNFLKAL